MDNLIESFKKITRDYRFPMALAILLIILIFITLYQDIREVQYHHGTMQSIATQESSPQAQAQAMPNISEYHLFGKAPTAGANIPKTNLNFKLLGTFAIPPHHTGTAIISINGKEHLYGIGDKLAENVSLKKVYANHVVILRNGVEEMLYLETDLPPGLKQEPFIK